MKMVTYFLWNSSQQKLWYTSKKWTYRSKRKLLISPIIQIFSGFWNNWLKEASTWQNCVKRWSDVPVRVVQNPPPVREWETGMLEGLPKHARSAFEPHRKCMDRGAVESVAKCLRHLSGFNLSLSLSVPVDFYQHLFATGSYKITGWIIKRIAWKYEN